MKTFFYTNISYFSLIYHRFLLSEPMIYAIRRNFFDYLLFVKSKNFFLYINSIWNSMFC